MEAAPPGREGNLWLPFVWFTLWALTVWLLDRRVRLWPTPTGVLVALASAIGLIAAMLSPGVSPWVGILLGIAFVAALLEVASLYVRERDVIAKRRLALRHEALEFEGEILNLIRESVASAGVDAYDEAGVLARERFHTHIRGRLDSFIEKLASESVTCPTEMFALLEKVRFDGIEPRANIGEIEDLTWHLWDIAELLKPPVGVRRANEQ